MVSFTKAFTTEIPEKALLRKIRQLGEGLLALIPFDGHFLANNSGGSQQEEHGNHGENGQNHIHLPHFDDGHGAEQQSIEEHDVAHAEALLNGVQVVGKQAHQGADLVGLVVFLTQLLGVAEHIVSQVRFHIDGSGQNTHPPKEPAKDDGQNHTQQGHTDLPQQKFHVKGQLRPVHIDIAVVDAVNDHLVQPGCHQVHIVNDGKSDQAQQEQGSIAEVVFINMLAENHINSNLLSSRSIFPYYSITGLILK